MLRRFAPVCLVLLCLCLALAASSRAQFSDSYRQAAQAYRNAASQCSGPQSACYTTWADYYDCVARSFQSGAHVSCQQPSQDCSKLGGDGNSPTQPLAPGAAAPANTNSDPVLNLLSSLPPPKTSAQLYGRMGLGMGLEALNIWAKHHNSSASSNSSDDSTGDGGGPAGPTLEQQANDQEDQALAAMNAADQQQNAQQFQRGLLDALTPDAQATAEDALSANSAPPADAGPPDPSQTLLNDVTPDPGTSAAIPDVQQVPAMEQSVAQQAGPEWTQALNSVQGQQQTSPASTNQLLTGSWQQLDQEAAPATASADASSSSWHNPLEDAVPEGLMLTAQKAAADLVSGVETTIGDALHNLPMNMAIAKGADMLLDAKDSAVCDGESDQIVHGNCMIDQAGSEVGSGIATRIFAIHRQFYENILNPMVQRFFPNPD